jgi:hypothetical protein
MKQYLKGFHPWLGPLVKEWGHDVHLDLKKDK